MYYAGSCIGLPAGEKTAESMPRAQHTTMEIQLPHGCCIAIAEDFVSPLVFSD
jgi:hypothetical protein